MGRRGRAARRARVQLGPAAGLLSVQAYLRVVAAEGRRRHAAGPFDVFVHPRRAAPSSNYAIPHDGARPTAADVAGLVAAFGAARRTPRLEFLPRTAPEAEAALVAAGFGVELRTTVMSCHEPGLRPVAAPPGVTLEALTAASTLADANALQRVQAVAFGDEPEPYPERPPWLGHLLAVLARADGEPAGGGMCLTVAHGTTELVGIAVAEPFRRRGIAAAITSELARMAFQRGALTAFLTPGDDAATRVYARAGFAPTDTMLHLRLNGSA